MNNENIHADHQQTHEEVRTFAKEAGRKIAELVKKLSRIKLRISKDGCQKLNLPLPLFIIIALINLPLTVLAAIVGVLCDYVYQVDMNGVTF